MSEFVETPLGILPRSWRIKPLGETTIKIQDGTHFSPQTDEGPCLYLTSKNIKFGKFDIKDCGWISQQEHDSIYARCDVKFGDVLLTKDGANTGNACLNNLTEPFSLLSSVAFLRTDGVNNHSGFILQYLLSPIGQRRLKDLMSGNAIPRLTLQKIKAFTTPVPTSDEQRRIATILTALDEVIEATEKLVEKHQQIKAGLMHDLFTRGLWTREELARGDHQGTPAEAAAQEGQLRPTPEEAPGLYQDSPLGLIPKTWRCEKLDNLLTTTGVPMRSGPFGSALLKDELVENGIPLLGIDNVFVERFEPTFRRFVSPWKFMELSRYAVFAGDVVITIMGTVGRCCVIPENIGQALSSKHLWSMTFDTDQVLPELVCWQLNHSEWVKDWFLRHAQGAVMDAIQSSTLRTLRLPVPPIDEQREILAHYHAVSGTINTAEIHLAKLRQQKQGLMHDLLTGQVRVNLASNK